MDFMFECQEQYLTCEHSKRVRYCSCHDNIKFISWFNPLVPYVLSDILDVRSRTFSENFRRLPKTFEGDPKMFRSYTNEFNYSLKGHCHAIWQLYKKLELNSRTKDLQPGSDPDKGWKFPFFRILLSPPLCNVDKTL